MTRAARRMLTAALLILLAPAALSRADVVTLKDGRVVEGLITSETRGSITIDTLIANIRTSEEIPRFRIATIERRPLPEGFFEPDRPDREASAGGDGGEAPREEDRRAREREPEDAASHTQYLVIPVEGTIGEQVTATGLAEALRQAERRQVGHVVFVIDSPGGYLFEAKQILDVLRDHDEGLVYHAYIEDGAISAASVFVAGADHIYVAPDARLGGAVAYSTDNSTGAAQVDAKLNSIWASELAARAESKGHSPDAFRAMAEPDAELWLSEGGELRAAKVSPADEQIDGRRTVLTLRATQMTRAGMAEEIGTGPGEIGALRGLEGWRESPRLGARAMGEAAKRRQRLIERHSDLKRRLDLAVDAANEADPSSGRYYEDRSTGRFTSGSLMKWQQACDAAVARWNEVRSVLLALADLDKDAREDGALHLITDEEQGNELYARVSERLTWLGQNRNRTTAP